MQEANPREVLEIALEALSHPIRRQVLTQVKASDPLDVDEVLADLTEEGTAQSAALVVPVTHVHLPKLADAGFIDWDRDSGVIRRGPGFHEVEPVIELLDEHEDELPVGWP